ncbi:glycosyltransferase family 2 protein [Thalassotalea fonticola]|uniref:Glycosyltransferase family 2 protein n=1 Tax=Thalassotalea fonticola TaxID=3065649 RepID=A0ABZ0GU56_9GAMM|nr:glycosyltransferase family 2 protein [Colwelliaceae bacterium S1-1]
MISLICPIYNEEESIESFLIHIKKLIDCHNLQLELLFIDDGSSDHSLKVLINAKKENDNIRIIRFSRNFGKEAALTAGLNFAKGAAVIPIDVDLQDPPQVIVQLIEKWNAGYQIVLAKRSDRKKDSFLKRITANFFYSIHNKLADHKIPANVGDFRLMDRRVVEEINKLPERQRFMKGLFSWVGFNSTTITYSRAERNNGTSKFSFWKLWNFAIEGITSFSTIPLKIWSYIGAIVAVISFIYGIFIIFLTLFSGVEVPGYSSLMVVILFLGGIQLIGIGVLGEYIGRIYLETKARPLFIIDKEY